MNLEGEISKPLNNILLYIHYGWISELYVSQKYSYRQHEEKKSSMDHWGVKEPIIFLKFLLPSLINQRLIF